MNHDVTQFVTLFTVMLVLMIVGYITPFVARKGIVFGVQLGPGTDSGQIAHLKYRFKVVYMITQLFYLIIVGYLYSLVPTQNIGLVAILIQVILTFTILIIHNLQASKLKTEPSSESEMAFVAVDTSPRSTKLMLPMIWFLPGLIMVLLNIAIPILRYNHELLAAIILSFPSLVILMASLVVYFTIKTSKQELDPNYPRTSSAQDQEFRYRWSVFIVAFSIVLTGFSLILSMRSINALNVSDQVMLILNLGIMAAILIVPLIIALKTGQQGSLIPSKIQEAGQGLSEYDHDKFWKYGLIYINKLAPSFFMAKRMGIGWTLNFGNPLVPFAFVLFLILVITLNSIAG